MRAAGIDIGSRTIKLALVEDARVSLTRLAWNTHDPLSVCRDLLRDLEFDTLVATGYGRHLFRQYEACEAITEIRAVALGSRHLSPTTRAVLDIGGQDTKAIALEAGGGLRKFEMNDRCAAGTGRFLEVMASALGCSMEDFVAEARDAGRSRKISSMCTVFAESEVVSLLARGVPRGELALGIHRAIAERSVAMLQRIPLEGAILFCGGGALNRCLREGIEELSGRPVRVPEEPQLVAAVGSALHAAERRCMPVQEEA